MKGRARSTTIVAPRKTWRDKNGRTLVIKGTAAFLLLVFTTIFLHGNWPIALLWVGGGAGLWGLSELVRRRRERAEVLRDVEAMNDEEFRRYAADLLRAQGYVAHRATGPEGQRVDFLLTRGRASFVCRLQRQGQRVGKDVVTEALVALEACRCGRVMILTNQLFTLPARSLARREGCVLIDRGGLASLVAQHRQGHRVLAFHREETARLRRRK
jgi:restriction system protein